MWTPVLAAPHCHERPQNVAAPQLTWEQVKAGARPAAPLLGEGHTSPPLFWGVCGGVTPVWGPFPNPSDCLEVGGAAGKGGGWEEGSPGRAGAGCTATGGSGVPSRGLGGGGARGRFLVQGLNQPFPRHPHRGWGPPLPPAFEGCGVGSPAGLRPAGGGGAESDPGSSPGLSQPPPPHRCGYGAAPGAGGPGPVRSLRLGSRDPRLRRPPPPVTSAGGRALSPPPPLLPPSP